MLPSEYKQLDTVLNMNIDSDSFLRELSELLAENGKGILQTQWLREKYEIVSSIFEKTQQTISDFLIRNMNFPRIVIIDTRNKLPGKLAKEIIKPLFDRNVAVLALIYKKSIDEPIRVSLRVKKSDQDYYDVSKVAVFFGGGGHRMAAACTPKQELIPNALVDQLKTIKKPNDTIGYFSL
jgi:nanoRNase/pAp phosphatase (c-di-AMP/oligoRNAs hydrolase)